MNEPVARGARIARDIKRGCIVLIVLAILFALAILVLGIFASTVEAAPVEQTCNVRFYVQVLSGLSANIRSGPGVSFNTSDNAITSAAGELPSDLVQDGWYRLCGLTANGQARWVSSTYNNGQNKLLNVRAASPTPTVTPTRTATATNTPVVQVPTPTRIVSTPTVSEAVAVTINGVTYICDLPCSFWIDKP